MIHQWVLKAEEWVLEYPGGLFPGTDGPTLKCKSLAAPEL